MVLILGFELFKKPHNGPREYIVFTAVPGGPVLGSLLWNILYNNVLKVPVASEAIIVGYIDDIGMIVVAKYLADVELYSSEATTVIK